MDLLLTGSTGALGPPLVAGLLNQKAFDRIHLLIRPNAQGVQQRFESLIRAAGIGDEAHRLIPIEGNVTGELAFDCNPDVIIHAAADTRFRAPASEQMQTNVAGSQHVIDAAKRCGKLKRLILVSTTCVAGQRMGSIPESLGDNAAGFGNEYESSKWQAEHLFKQSGLPTNIVRISIVVGSEKRGTVYRPGALHHALRWIYRGLVPMMPGSESSVVDLISSELAADAISRVAVQGGPDVVHIAAGEHAIPLTELIDFVVGQFGEISPAWRRKQITKPMIVDAESFGLFRASVQRSGDVLFRSVLDSVTSFLPGLLHPKVYQTTQAERMFGGPLPIGDWQALLAKVILHTLADQPQCIIPPEVRDV
jgi:nucleoside-diphosphate-sugar epimerase